MQLAEGCVTLKNTLVTLFISRGFFILLEPSPAKLEEGGRRTSLPRLSSWMTQLQDNLASTISALKSCVGMSFALFVGWLGKVWQLNVSVSCASWISKYLVNWLAGTKELPACLLVFLFYFHPNMPFDFLLLRIVWSSKNWKGGEGRWLLYTL